MKRTIWLAAIPLLLAALPARATDFIKEVLVIGGTRSTVDDLANTYTNQGWTLVNKDLNAGCGGSSDYIYLLYRAEDNADGFNRGYITDFYISNQTDATTVTHDGRTYLLASYQGDDHFCTHKGDLNSHAGGDDIHLYYTTDTFPDNRAVTGISFNATKSGAVGVNGDTSTGYDLNKGCGSNSAYIYMHVATAAAAPLPFSGAGTAGDPFLISSADDWARLVANVGDGLLADKFFRLTANIGVSTMVGTTDHPFRGVFDGNGRTLTVNISSSEQGAAPFRCIAGARIANLTVAGAVTSTAHHAAGLVGLCSGGANAVSGCTVSASVSAPGYAGGIVGHGGASALVIENSVCGGTIRGFANYAGGLLGWCESMTLTVSNCLFKGSFSPADGGKYHPVACKRGASAVTAAVSDTYYVRDQAPTATGNILVPGAEGLPVAATYDADECWTQPVAAADGRVYYLLSVDLFIDSAAEWDAFAADVNSGAETYAGKTVALIADIAVTTMVGTGDHPFAGTFNGVGHTLAVAINGAGAYAAPFSRIGGATIRNLAVTGSVSGGYHSAGLVGLCGGTATNLVRNCTVAVAVSASGCAGGIVGEARGALALENGVFTGTISGFDECAGGFVGRCGDALALSIDNCLFKGDIAPAAGGVFHPVACKDAAGTVTAAVERVYYLHTATPTATGDVLVPGAGGTAVSATSENGAWSAPVLAADGVIYFSEHHVFRFFVDGTDGDDANDGLTPVTAFRTIQKAIDSSVSGDAIRVAAGRYGGVDSGGRGLMIVGDGAASTVIDGGRGTCATLHGGTTLRGFTLRNGNPFVAGGRLEDCIVEDSRILYGFGLYGSGSWIQSPISGTDTVRCIVRNCSLLEFVEPLVDGGTHRNTLFSGLVANTVFQGATLCNCTVVDCEATHHYDEDGLLDDGFICISVACYNCIFWGNHSTIACVDPDDQTYSLFPLRVSSPENDAVDPKFMNRDDGDYHLRPDSPAVDTGDPSHAAKAGGADLDMRPRVQNGRIDRGCYEGCLDAYIATTVIGCGSVSPEHIAVSAQDAVTFMADSGGWNRPVVGWYTNGVLAAAGGDTFTLSGVTEDTAVTVRFAAADWHVDATSGDDANDGLTAATAFRTIWRAFNAGLRDDIVHVAAGTYPAIDDGGCRRFVVGAGAGRTVIDADGTNRCATLGGGTTLRHLTLRNGRDDGHDGCAGVLGGALEDCVVEDCSGRYCAPMRDTDTLRCIVRNHWTGYDAVVGGTHRNTLFCGMYGWHAVFVEATLYNCTVADNAGTKFFGKDLVARNCVFWGNSSNNDAENPLFVWPESGDYRLRDKSPAIDTGDPAYASEAGETDLAGNARVQGAAIDRGCYEGGVAGLVRFTAAVDGGGGTVAPATVVTNAPATATFVAESHPRIERNVVGWYTNGVIAAVGGGTFTLADWSEDVNVSVRFAATNLYVDATLGNDSNDGFTPATAFRTIQAAIDISASRDTIRVAAGTYAPIDTGGRSVTIVGADAASTVIEGGGGRCALLSGGATLAGFTLRSGYTAAESDGAAAKFGSLVDCVVENCDSGDYATILQEVNTTRCIVRNCTSSSMWGSIIGGTHRNTLIHSVSQQNGWFFSQETKLFNCTVADNRNGTLTSPTQSANCIFWGNARDNDAVDPMFVSAAGGDYRLRAGSPAIDSGDAAYAAEAGETDLAGDLRVQGSAIDRGCYEGSGISGIVIDLAIEGHGNVSPNHAIVTGPEDAVLFTADTSVWGCPVVGWFTNGVCAAGAQNTFRISGVAADTVITVKFAPGATIYVDGSTGNDANDGLSPARARRTIQRAIDIALSGDTIRVAAGTYAPIHVGGRAITIIGAGAASTVINDGKCATLAEGATLRGFTLRNGRAWGLTWVDPLDYVPSVVSSGLLEDCIVEGCTGADDAAVLFGTSTTRCIVRNCSSRYFIVLKGDHRNSLFCRNQVEGDCIVSYANSYNCTFADNAAQLLMIGTVVNAVRWGNACDVSHLAPGSYIEPNDAVDPLFVDAAHGDYHLLQGSPAINSGNGNYAAQAGLLDLDCNARVRRGRIDRGCYETSYDGGTGYEGAYGIWAGKYGLGPSTDVTEGVPNLIRYVFDRPTGACNPFEGFGYNEEGKPWLRLLRIANTDDVTVKVISTTNLNDWSSVDVLILDDVGIYRIPFDYDAPTRFFRLKVTQE
jgi:hypothetical protein